MGWYNWVLLPMAFAFAGEQGKDLSPYLHEKPYRSFKKESVDQRLRKVQVLIEYIKTTPNIDLPLFCDSESVFSKAQNWECNGNEWRSDFELLEVIKDKFTIEQLQRCQNYGEQTSKWELLEAEKNNYDKRQLIAVAKKYPFTKASLKALLLLSELELAFGNSTVAALTGEIALKRVKQFPSLFDELLNSRTLFKVALAYSASEQRDEMNWEGEKAQVLSRLKTSLKGKDLLLGKKKFSYEELEKEVNRKKEWVQEAKEIDWENPPFSFLYPEKKKQSLVSRQVRSVDSLVNADVEFYNLLLLGGRAPVQKWIGKSLSKLSKVNLIEDEIIIPSARNYFGDCLENNFLMKSLMNNHGQIVFPEQVLSLDFRRGNNPSLVYLKEFQRLSSLSLRGQRFFVDKDLVHLSDLKNLSHLSLRETSVTGSGFSYLKGLKNLAFLDLADSQVNDEGLSVLKEVRNLSNLVLQNTKITEKGFCFLKDLRNLSSLTLEGQDITDESLRCIGSLNALTSLSIKAHNVTDRGLFYLKNLKNLLSLQLNAKSISDKGLKFIKELTNLSSLEIWGEYITNEGMQSLKELQNLKSLDLSFSRVNAQGLIPLKTLPRLSTLVLDHAWINTDEALELLKDFKNLSSLSFSGPTITQKGMLHLKKFRSLSSLNISHSKMTNDELAPLGEVENLKSLSLVFMGNITSKGWGVLKGLKNLSSLDLSYSSITDEALKNIKELKNLSSVRFNFCTISNVAVMHLKELGSLYSLDLANTNISDEALRFLVGLKSLSSLRITLTNTSDEGIKEFKKRRPDVRIESQY